MTDAIVDPPTVPSTPSPEITALVASLIRHILTFLSGVGVIGGVYSDNMIALLASALIGVAMAGWALYQKIQAAKKDHVASVISAETGVPVKVK
jgi:hypothetical protein